MKNFTKYLLAVIITIAFIAAGNQNAMAQLQTNGAMKKTVTPTPVAQSQQVKSASKGSEYVASFWKQDGNSCVTLGFFGSSDLDGFGGGVEGGYFNKGLFLGGEYRHQKDAKAVGAVARYNLFVSPSSKIIPSVGLFVGACEQYQATGVRADIDHPNADGNISVGLGDYKLKFNTELRIRLEFRLSERTNLFAQGGLNYMPFNGKVVNADKDINIDGAIASDYNLSLKGYHQFKPSIQVGVNISLIKTMKMITKKKNKK